MLRKLSSGLLLGALLLVSACGAARVVRRDQTGGIIELQGDRGEAMKQANGEMNAHCGPNNWTIVQEGEEVIGQDTYTREDTASDSKTSRSGRRSSTDTTTAAATSTRDAVAWRVHYQCGGGQMGGPPPGPPAGPPPGPPPGPAPSGW